MESDKRAQCGAPSYVWRAGQERRFAMLERWAQPVGRRVLDVGCGIGMYSGALQRLTPAVFGVEVEFERAHAARERATGVVQAIGERLPFATEAFDAVLSHEVLEHVTDDRACLVEMVRVTRPGGRIVIFVPNRLYPFETHGVYWRGRYHFGNVPLVNWLPERLRRRLAPHVRAYTVGGLRRMLRGLPVEVAHHAQIFPGYDNLVARLGGVGRLLRTVSYTLEQTPLRIFGLSHLLVLERTAGALRAAGSERP